MTLPESIAVAFFVLCTALLFCAGVVVLGLGAWVWANATAAAARARAHVLSADEQERLSRDAHDAVDDLRMTRTAPPPSDVYEGPSDADIRAALLAEREERERAKEYTTAGNDGFVEQPIMDGGFYRRTEE